MSENGLRPTGVAIVGWLYIVFGSLATLAVLAWIGLAVSKGAMSEGLPLEFLLAPALTILLGIVPGVAALRGRPWAWYVITTLSVIYAFGNGWTFASDARDLMAAYPEALPYFTAITLVQTAFALAVFVFFYTGKARGFFGLGGRAWWKPAAIQILACAVLVFAVDYTRRNAGAEFAADAANTRMQGLGDSGIAADEDYVFLLERLERGAIEERINAAWALGRVGRADAVPKLLGAAREDSDTSVRINAIASLADLGGADVGPVLQEFLLEDDPEIRSAGLRALADARFAASAQSVAGLLADTEVTVRLMAAEALGGMGNADVVPALLELRADPDAEVRTRVAFSLGKLRDAAAVTGLIEMLDDESWEVRANAAQALGSIGDPRARDPLKSLLEDPHTQVRGVAEMALDKLQ